MTAEARERSTLEAISAMPLCLNPAACEPELEPRDGSEYVALRRTTDVMLQARRENTQRRLARQGFVLVRDLMPHLSVAAMQDGTLRARLDEDSVRAALRHHCRYTLPALRALVALWPQRWLASIRDGVAPIAQGEWVSLTIGGVRKIGRVASRGRRARARHQAREPTPRPRPRRRPAATRRRRGTRRPIRTAATRRRRWPR